MLSGTIKMTAHPVPRSDQLHTRHSLATDVHDPRAARGKGASWRRVDQRGRLGAGPGLPDAARAWVGNGREQKLGVGVRRLKRATNCGSAPMNT